jgi:hypothetical protein
MVHTVYQVASLFLKKLLTTIANGIPATGRMAKPTHNKKHMRYAAVDNHTTNHFVTGHISKSNSMEQRLRVIRYTMIKVL